MTTTRESAAGDDLLADYGTSAAKVEPGGIERIPAHERHGRPWHLFATWMSPNLEFATVFVGVIGVLYFGLSFWQTLAAVVIGNALGSISHGVLSAWGPRHGLAQMVLGRTAFGYRGNMLPADADVAHGRRGLVRRQQRQRRLRPGHAVRISPRWSLAVVIAAQVLVAFFGHNLVQALRARGPSRSSRSSSWSRRLASFGHADLGAPGSGGVPAAGAFLIDARRGLRLRGRVEPVRLGLHALPARGRRPPGRLLRRPR